LEGASPYEAVSTEYEHGRPAYAPDAIAHVVDELALDRESAVLDLGAGTGKLTSMLVARGLHVTAVEPSPAMLARLRASVPEAQALEGTAESIPLPGESVDAVTAAQAFHWFDADEALAEAHRVLRPGGGIALLWNRRDLADPVQALLEGLTDPPERTTPRGWKLDVPALVASTRSFGPVSSSEFEHVQPTDENRLMSRLRSSSFVAGLPSDRREALEQRLTAGLEQLGPVTRIAFTTIVYLARRR
jgi:SAM-dependent methyltransferase